MAEHDAEMLPDAAAEPAASGAAFITALMQATAIGSKNVYTVAELEKKADFDVWWYQLDGVLEEAGIKLNERRRRKEQKRKRQEQIRAVESRRHDSVFVPDDHDTSDGHDTNDDHDVNTTTV